MNGIRAFVEGAPESSFSLGDTVQKQPSIRKRVLSRQGICEHCGLGLLSLLNYERQMFVVHKPLSVGCNIFVMAAHTD